MAKKNSIAPFYLFLSGSILLSLAWLMPSFPLLAFIGLTPFIAIAVNNRKEKSMWDSLELVLLGLSISFFAATLYIQNELAHTIVYAIFFTMPFVGYTFVRKTLGQGVSISTIILFWLALEYIFLKWSPMPTVFLADSLRLKPEWTRWNQWTGYLGSSLWILVCNIILFQAILTEKKVNWFYVILFIIMVSGPILYSYSHTTESINREQMIQLYSSADIVVTETYRSSGEFIPRTSAWVSLLILLYTLVKRKTSKK